MTNRGTTYMHKEFKAVYIKFLDHSSGSAATLSSCECEVFGILRNETEKEYFVISWICDGDLRGEDSDAYCVLKSCVVEFEELEVKDNENANEK